MQPYFFNLETLTNQNALSLKTQSEVLSGPIEVSLDVYIVLIVAEKDYLAMNCLMMN